MSQSGENTPRESVFIYSRFIQITQYLSKIPKVQGKTFLYSFSLVAMGVRIVLTNVLSAGREALLLFKEKKA